MNGQGSEGAASRTQYYNLAQEESDESNDDDLFQQSCQGRSSDATEPAAKTVVPTAGTSLIGASGQGIPLAGFSQTEAGSEFTHGSLAWTSCSPPKAEQPPAEVPRNFQYEARAMIERCEEESGVALNALFELAESKRLSDHLVTEARRRVIAILERFFHPQCYSHFSLQSSLLSFPLLFAQPLSPYHSTLSF